MLKKHKKLIIYIAICFWAFITMLVMAQICKYGITGLDIILPCLFVLNILVFLKTYQLLSGNNREYIGLLRCFVPIGMVMDLCTVVGNKIDIDNAKFDDVGIIDVAYILILIPFFVCVVELLFFYADCATESLKAKGIIEAENKSEKKQLLKSWVICSAVMFVCWLPYYLTYFPGGINEDDFECINIIFGNIPWVNHHPVLYTATMKMFIFLFESIGGLNLALGMMVLGQMLMMSFTLGAMLIWLKYHGAGKVWIGVSLAFVSLHSAFSMFSVCLTKDVSFSCVVVLLVLFLYDFCEKYIINYEVSGKKSGKDCAILGVLSFLVIVTRNNGTMVMVVTYVALLVAVKKLRKQLLIVAIIVFSLNGFYKGPVWKTFGIQKQSFVESASIPLTQIAFTIYSDGVIEGEDREYLESIMPLDEVKRNFIPGVVDSYKFDENFNTEVVDNDPIRLIEVWWHLLPNNFGKYVKAYLYQTCGYWHYGVTNTLCTAGVKPNVLGIKSTDYIEGVTGVSLSGLLSELMLVVRKLPVLCMFTQMAVQMLAVILTAVQLVRRKKPYLTVALIPLFAIWGSIMIAVPSYCLFRYMLPAFFLWPMLIYCFMKKE